MEVLILGSIQLGLLYALMAMGVYVSFRVLDTPDLTVDGSFTLGMAVSIMVALTGHPVIAIVAATVCGAISGFVTGFLQTKLKIDGILAGILTMYGLYTVNMFIMGGKSNISILGKDTVFSLFETLTGLSSNASKLILALLFVIAFIVILDVFFKTPLGLAIRATGDNEDMVRASSINADYTKNVGFCLGNGLVALSGALIGQYSLFADAMYGVGIAVMGLASVIIGERIFGQKSVFIALIAASVGSVIYRIIIAAALKVEILPAYGLKLVSALIVALAICIPYIKEQIVKRKERSKRAKLREELKKQ